MAKLVVRKGRNIGAEYKLNADRLVMGRRSACPIPVLDPKSSREHAVITRKDGLFFIQNLSRNGTYLNSEEISKNGADLTPIKFGDKIKIGDTVMEVVDEKSEPIHIEIPGYKIVEKIGAGGMGMVYKAKQLSMDRIVALKVLNEKYSADREFVDRFIREARAAGKLNHPNVIHVHDVSKANGRHYFSMEFIDGSSVKEMLRIEKKMSPNKALDIVIQTAKALEFAHENGIVHRDIKPDNIMLTKDGVVKIADLGIAKTFEDTGSATKELRRVMGTPHYMAPEQALGKEIDHRVDIYSLGATFYHMLTGTTPFSGSTAHEVLKAHIQESLPAIQEYETQVPDPVCFIVERMMAKLPEKRYPNMTRLIEDLERAHQGIAEGIERIAAGDSTIMRAIGAKDAAEHAAKKRKTREATEEVGTGVQSPVTKMALYAGLAGLFIVVVVLVVWLARPPRPGDDGAHVENPAVPSPDPAPGVIPASPTASAEAEKKVGEAKNLLAMDAASTAAEGLLRDVLIRYPTSKVRDEAQVLLDGIVTSRREAERKKAQAFLDEAKKFESENRNDPAKMTEIAQRFRTAQSKAQGVPALAEQAKNLAEQWESRNTAEAAKKIEEDLKSAESETENAVRQHDYDAARKVLQDFVARNGSAPQKARADERLKTLNEEATREFQQAVEDAQRAEKDTGHPLPTAMKVWDDYLAKVKDATNRPAAETNRKELDTRAEKFVQLEGGKIADLAKQYDYDAALQLNRVLRQRLAGTKWADDDKVREKELMLQETLHERVLKSIGERTQGGPVPLPFKLEIARLDVKDWAIASATGARLTLSALPKGSGLGSQKKMGELAPDQQYKIYMHFIPEPTVDLHKALVAFCKERGLNDEAAVHAAKATTP